MFTLIEFFQRRPKDTTIRTIRIIFGLLIAVLLGFNLGDITLNLPESAKAYEQYIIYGLFIFALFPIIMGATGICFAKRKHIRIAQISLGVMLMIVGNALVETRATTVPTPINTNQSGSLDYGALTQKTTAPERPMNVGFWLAFLGLFPIFGGISGKLITQKCLKHGEIIKKIRV